MKSGTMFEPARSLFLTPEEEGDALRRLQEDNPFYRARAERHEKLAMAIRDLEWTLPWDRSRATANYIKLLKKRRDALAEEMAVMAADAAGVIELAPTPAATVARHEAPAPQAPQPRRKFDWKWP